MGYPRLPSCLQVAALIALAACNPPPSGEDVTAAQEGLVSPLIDLGDHATGPSNDQPPGVGVAYGGGVYLVVWGTGAGKYQAVRLSATGDLLDATPINLGAVDGTMIAFDGTNFRVFGGTTFGGLSTVRISPAGNLLDSPPKVFDAGYSNFKYFQAACLSSTCVLVGWQALDSAGSDELVLARVGPNGEEVDPSPVPIAGTNTGPSEVGTDWNIIATSTGYLVTWVDPTANLWTLALDSTGTATGAARRTYATPDPSNEYLQPLAFNGTEVLFVEQAVGVGAPSTCYGGRLDQSGAALDSALHTYPDSTPCTAIASNRSTFLTTARDMTGVSALEIGNDGAPAGSIMTSAGSNIQLFTKTPVLLASDGSHYLQISLPVHGIQRTLLDTHGTVVAAPTDIELTPVTVSAPAVASNGDSFLTIWSDSRLGGNNGVYGTVVARDGTVVAKGLPISQSGQFYPNVGPPALAWNGSKYLAAWARHPGLGLTLISSDARSTTDLMTNATAYYGPAVASNGSGYLVVWTDVRNLVSDIYMTRVDGAGTVLDGDGVKIATASSVLNEGTLPRVASSGRGYSLVWPHRIDNSHLEAELAVISDTGSMLLSPTSISVNQSDVDGTDIACGPQSCLAVWTSGQRVFLRSLAPSGSPLTDPSPLSGAAGSPRVAWNGTEFVVTSLDGGIYNARFVKSDGSLSAGPVAIFGRGDAGSSSTPTSYALGSNGAGIAFAAENPAPANTLFGAWFTDDGAPPPEGGVGLGGDARGNGNGGTDGTSAASTAGSTTTSGGTAGNSTNGTAGSGSAGTTGAATSSGATAGNGSGSGGSSGNTGSSGTSSDDAGANNATAGAAPASDSSGCGCVMAQRSGSPWLASLAAIAAALGVRRRRQRAPRC
jgi:MYXO-CTERM domain-containing protein